MTNTDALKSFLNNFINDKPEEATLDLHNYFTTKMKEVAGIGGAPDPALDPAADPVVSGDPDPALETPAA